MVFHENVWDCKFQILKIPHKNLRRKCTKQEVMKQIAIFFAWSFGVLQEGHAPPLSFYGEAVPGVLSRPLAGGYRACFTGLKGDGKARVEANSFKNNYSSIHMCDFCCATAPFPTVLRDAGLRQLLFTNFDLDAQWRSTMLDHEQYMLLDGSSPWAIVPGWRKELVLLDWMHIGPLGFFRDLAGSVCAEFIERRELGNVDDDEALKGLWLQFRQWCHENHIRPPTGTLSKALIGRTKRNMYAELSTTFKASVVKVFMVFLSQKVVALAHDVHTRLRATCCWSLSEIIRIWDTASQFLTVEDCQRLERVGNIFFLAYAALAHEAATAKLSLYKCRPKLHYFWHLLVEAINTKFNPRHFSCYMEETFMGRMKRLASKCSGRSVLTTSLQRYVWYLGLRWELRRRSGVWVMSD